jgi:transposase
MTTSSSARRKAELILQVQTGVVRATEAASLLGLSRKTYYQWEKRALRGMLQALERGRPGRPRSGPEGEVQRLRRQVRHLEKELRQTRQVARLRELLIQVREPQPRAKKGGSSKSTSP